MSASLLEKVLRIVQVIAAIVEYALKLFVPDSKEVE